VTSLVAALEAVYGLGCVAYEHVRDERYRFEIVSKLFNSMPHPKRQRAVWDIVSKVVDKTQLLNVAMILTIADDELYEPQSE